MTIEIESSIGAVRANARTANWANSIHSSANDKNKTNEEKREEKKEVQTFQRIKCMRKIGGNCQWCNIDANEMIFVMEFH